MWDLLSVLVARGERQSQSRACPGVRAQAPLLELSVDVKDGLDQVLVGLAKACHSAFLPVQMLLGVPVQVLLADHGDSGGVHRMRSQAQRTVACVGHTVEQSAVDSQDLEARDRLSKDDLVQAHLRQALDGDQDGAEMQTMGVLLERW